MPGASHVRRIGVAFWAPFNFSGALPRPRAPAFPKRQIHDMDRGFIRFRHADEMDERLFGARVPYFALLFSV